MKSMQKGFTLIELMIVVAIIAILAAIAIPQYQTYVIKSQVSRAMGEAGDAKVVIEDCLNNGQSTVGTASTDCTLQALTPSDILSGAQQGSEAAPPTGTGYAQVNPLSGTGQTKVIATLGNHASAKISGGTITWARTGSGAWTCSTDGTIITSNYAPASCQ
ncbi:pilin [Rhodanobacter sp. DHG33]|uniref:pilin n=1 Tax=Rhodanobacter sp. DHG33 TaxID=2775921 RepID=UPI00178266AC|nr:pilin [Rhodanobacter sp. DHG33]MBD8899282.1 pilin [Rhodanobacter sp. DHG33]